MKSLSNLIEEKLKVELNIDQLKEILTNLRYRHILKFYIQSYQVDNFISECTEHEKKLIRKNVSILNDLIQEKYDEEKNPCKGIEYFEGHSKNEVPQLKASELYVNCVV